MSFRRSTSPPWHRSKPRALLAHVAAHADAPANVVW
jgi:hypothetical protein